MAGRKKVRYQIRFFGQVQGVGFRYTANTIAQSLGITGWVMNDWDGTVLMEAQGTDTEIEKLIAQLHNGVFIEISKIEKTPLSLIPEERSFKIKSW